MEVCATAFDTFIVFAGAYPDLASAEADYELVKELHSDEGLMNAYDAAVIHRRADGKVKIARKHETPTGVGGVLGGGAGLATGLVVVGAVDMEARIERSMCRSGRLHKKQLKSDAEALERLATEADAPESRCCGCRARWVARGAGRG